jgi:hypothetical protein
MNANLFPREIIVPMKPMRWDWKEVSLNKHGNPLDDV